MSCGRTLLVWALSLMQCAGAAASGPDYSKRAQPLDPALRARLLGKWTNPVDSVVIEITALDLTSGRIQGKEWPTTGPAAGNEHELIGWVSVAPPKEGYDSVVAVSFSTTLYEYGTLPAWAGFMRDEKIITMHYLVWPVRLYSWDHLSTFQETWSRIP